MAPFSTVPNSFINCTLYMLTRMDNMYHVCSFFCHANQKNAMSTCLSIYLTLVLGTI